MHSTGKARSSPLVRSSSAPSLTMADNDDMAGIHQAIAETAQQINEDVTTRYRAAAIALRQGQQVEQRNLNSSSTAPVEAKRPLNLAPKGIPMSLILSTDPDEGVVAVSACHCECGGLNACDPLQSSQSVTAQTCFPVNASLQFDTHWTF